jgi:hypothetical protein
MRGERQASSPSVYRKTMPIPDGDEGLLLIETDGRASPADVVMQDVTARLLAERFERASVWCATTGRPEYGGGQPADPPAPGSDPPAWYSGPGQSPNVRRERSVARPFGV